MLVPKMPTEYKLNIEIEFGTPTDLENTSKAFAILSCLKPVVKKIETICNKKSDGHRTDGKTLDVGFYFKTREEAKSSRDAYFVLLAFEGFKITNTTINEVTIGQSKKFSKYGRRLVKTKTPNNDN